MRIVIILILLFFFNNSLYSQDVKFNKSTLRVDEPYEKGVIKKDTFNIELKADNIPAGGSISVLIQKSSKSTYRDSLFLIITPTIKRLVSKNIIQVSIATDTSSSDDKYVVLTANWELKGEKKQVIDTLFIKNIYPSKVVAEIKGVGEKDYTEWNDGKRAEIFIGKNFDFIDSKVTWKDWYGGARVFLPAITDVGYKRDQSNHIAKWGFAGGIYHAKSLSNFGNPLNNDSIRVVYGRITGATPDSAFVRYDTVTTKTKTEINNWGLYFTPLYQYSRFESNDGKFITTMHVGLHAEVIRRNITTSYTFDTVGSTTKTYKLRDLPRSATFWEPQTNTQTFYDAYYGICAPIQFLWKDILDITINPCVGIGSRGYSTQVLTKADQQLKNSPFFYLVQFDLLARLGGIRLNIGGEVRGYFPNESPIITSYLGTSFSIQKLVDFVAK